MITPPDLSLVLIMLCFSAVFFVVSSQLVKPLLRILDQREHEAQDARGGLGAARAALQDALASSERELAVASAEATRERSGQRAAGEASRRARLEAAREVAQQRLASLGKELDAAAAEARAGLRSQVGQLATELATRMLGRRLRV